MLISIITINLNNFTGLKKTFESVFSQTFTDFEYIVVDGGSVDESPELIKNNQDKISYWQIKKDAGIYQALNQGIKKSKGKYLLFLHSGDYFLDYKALERIFTNDLSVDIIYADAKRLNEKNNKIEIYSQPDHLTSLFFYRYSLCHQSMFFKRELFDKFGFYREDLKIVADWAFNLKIFLSQGCTWQHLSTPIVYFDTNGLSSQNVELLNQERNQVLREFFNDSELVKMEQQFLFRKSLFGKILIKFKIINRF